MEADDKKTEDLHIVPGVVPAMDEYHCHSSNGSSCSSSNHRNAPLHKNGIHAAVSWSYCAPKLGSDILLQCQSPSVASSDHNHSASDVSGEETDFDELGDLLRRFDVFFREKVDTELQSLGEFMHGMLSEQQIHLQQILRHSRLFPTPRSPFSSQQETASVVSGDDDVFQKNHGPVLEPLDEIEMQLSTAESSEKYKRSATSEILLELMSLSCELSSLLSQSKFL